MQELKITKGSDGVIRRGYHDTEKGVMYYKGLAKDFQKNEEFMIIDENIQSAEDLINGADYD
jgi:hypothetical protein